MTTTNGQLNSHAWDALPPEAAGVRFADGWEVCRALLADPSWWGCGDPGEEAEVLFARDGRPCDLHRDLAQDRGEDVRPGDCTLVLAASGSAVVRRLAAVLRDAGIEAQPVAGTDEPTVYAEIDGEAVSLIVRQHS